MFDAAHPLASGWLWACVVVFTTCFGLPLTLVPLRWARVLGWRVPDRDPELTVYLGRSLGAVILVLAYLVAGVAGAPVQAAWAFQLITLAGIAMTAVHGWGWLRRTQPLSENLETIGFALVAAASWWISTTLT